MPLVMVIIPELLLTVPAKVSPWSFRVNVTFGVVPSPLTGAIHFQLPVGLTAGSPAMMFKPVTARNSNAAVIQMLCLIFIGVYLVNVELTTSLLTIVQSNRHAQCRLTTRITDPAPMASAIEQRRHRGVRCIRFVRHCHFKYLQPRNAIATNAAPPVITRVAMRMGDGKSRADRA